MKYSRGLNLAAMARLLSKPIGRGIKRKAVSQQSGKKKKRAAITRTRVKLSVPRRRPVKYYTMGRGPVRFKRGRRGTAVSKCRKYGSDIVFERRGVLTDSQRVDIGHAEIPALQTYYSMWRSIYRAVYERTGNMITNWEDIPNVRNPAGVVQTDQIFAELRYKRSEHFRTEPHLIRVVGTDQTHKMIAQQIADSVLNVFNATYMCVIFESIKLVCDDSAAGAFQWSGQLNLLTSKLHLKVMSCLVIQNRTKGAAAADDLADDVTNNPVYGRQFTLRGNALRFRVSNNEFTNNTNDVVADNYGLIFGGSTTQGGLRKIASPTMFQGTISSGKVNIQPGQVKKSTLYYDRTMSLQSFLNAFSVWMKDALSTSLTDKEIRIPLGKLNYFQFEKLCDTGEGTQSISIGYELNHTVCSYLTYDNHQGTARMTYSS